MEVKYWDSTNRPDNLVFEFIVFNIKFIKINSLNNKSFLLEKYNFLIPSYHSIFLLAT